MKNILAMVGFIPFTLISCSFIPRPKDNTDRDYYYNSAESDFPNCETKDELIPHIHCFLYYMCNNSQPTLNICEHNMYFNRKTGRCDQKDNVEDCVEGVRILPGSTFPSSLKHMFKVVSSIPTTGEEDFVDGKTDYVVEQEVGQPRVPRTEESVNSVIESFEEATQIIMPEFMQVPSTSTPMTTVTVEESTRRAEKITLETTPVWKKKDRSKLKGKSTTTTTTTTESTQATTTPMVAYTPVTVNSNETVGDGCTPEKIIIHHYPGPCRAEFTCIDGSSFVIEHCISNLIWKPKHFDMVI